MFRADRGRKHLNDQERAAIIAFTEAGKTVTPENEEDIVLAVSAKPITTAQEIAGNLFDQISLVPFFYI